MKFFLKTLFLLACSLFFLFSQDTIVNPFDLFWVPRKNLVNISPYLWSETDTLKGFSLELGQLGKPYMRFRYAIPTNYLFVNIFQEFENRNENIFWWKPQNLFFYDTKKPISYVCFNQSSNQTQILEALFSQSFNKNANFTVRYKRRTAEGSYLKSSTDHYNLSSYFYLKLFKEKLRLAALWVFNQAVDEMNGGADSLSLENSDFFKQKAQPVALQNAKLLRKGTYLTFPVAFRLTRNIQANYTFQKLWYEKNFSDKGFYKNISTPYFPYGIISDSLSDLQFGTLLTETSHSGNLQLRFFDKLGIQIGMKQRSQKILKSFLSLDEIKISSLSGKMFFQSKKWQFATQNRMNKYNIFSVPELFSVQKIRFSPTDTLAFSVKYEYHQRIPTYENLSVFPEKNLFTYYFPAGITESHIGVLEGSYKKFSLSGFVSAVFLQGTELQRYAGTELKIKEQKIIKSFFLASDLLLQTRLVSSFTKKIFPDGYLRGQIYWKDSVFHAGILQIGLDNYYYTSYDAPYFNPINQNFYVPTFAMQVPAYWRSDFVASLQIKRFTGFIRVLHWNEGFFGEKYFLVAGYPMWHRSFNFGIEWYLWD